MSRNKLPPLFAKYRFGLSTDQRPPVVLHLPEAVMKAHDAHLRAITPEDEDRVVQVWFFNHWWIETDDMAVLVQTRADETCLHHRIKGFYPRKVYPAFTLSYGYTAPDSLLPTELPDDLGQKYESILLLKATAVVRWLAEQPAEISVNTRTRNQAAAFAKQGDTFRYAKMTDLRTLAGQRMQRDYEPPAEPSGIRKREHDVRGFWRQYKSGVKVFVRPHKRGDPELGRCTRIVTA